MTDEELKVKEDEIKAQEEAITAKTQELDAKAKELEEREATIEASRANAEKLVTEVKEQYENKITKQAEEHKKELDERDNIIKGLMSDESHVEQTSLFDKINAKRALQNKY